ncbi:MAG: GDSL-type esterase/lipase family protein [Candidatus Sumerlaeota bacterium]|nr:GDSL-type esterase/lipase family protein [Candidatus Sumerlaeota bacterium]
MKIAIIGDSLGLPRPAYKGSQPVEYESTYVCILRNRLPSLSGDGGLDPHIIADHVRGRVMPEAAAMHEKILFYRPHVEIVHVGVVDCAPRIFSKRQQAIVDCIRPGFVKRAIIRFAHNHRTAIIRRFPNKVYVTLDQYRQAAQAIAQSCKTEAIPLAFVTTAPANAALASRSPGLNDNIVRYNAALKSICESSGAHYIDLHSEANNEVEKYILEDGHHLSSEGHAILARMIEDWIAGLLPQIKS